MDNKEAINWLTRIRDRLMTTRSKQFEAMTIAIAALEQQNRVITVTDLEGGVLASISGKDIIEADGVHVIVSEDEA